MPPKAETEYDVKLDENPKQQQELNRVPSNAELIVDAGKITLDEPQMWGRGIISDMKRTIGTHWLNEMRNFNHKTVAVTFLMFISVIAPTLTFGAVYGKVTNNHIGAIETILATAWIGVAYSFIGGMPLVRWLIFQFPPSSTTAQSHPFPKSFSTVRHWFHGSCPCLLDCHV
jgi:hypothetical protein